jgi:hypothetical protein
VIDSLTLQVGLMLGLMAVAMMSAAMLMANLVQSYSVGFWGRRAEDQGVDSGRRAGYRGPERRRRLSEWIDAV